MLSLESLGKSELAESSSVFDLHHLAFKMVHFLYALQMIMKYFCSAYEEKLNLIHLALSLEFEHVIIIISFFPLILCVHNLD